jgi:uncharacterized protein YjbI with pentapeptide repeats
MTTTTTITAAELMRKTMDGERDFTGSHMPQEQGLFTEDRALFDAFNTYMRGQELRANPIIAGESDWRGVRAPGAFLQFTKLPKSDLRGADFRGSELRRADFTESRLQGSDLSGANLMVSGLQRADLSGSIMRGVDLYEASLAGVNLRGCDLSNAYFMRLNFKEADLTDATVFMAQFYRADVRGAIGLETVLGLGAAKFHQLGVTDRELRIIESAIRSGPMFDIS